jgi:DNA-binding transcriptional LysR family regulator
MNELAMIRIFIQVAEDGSFSATARRRNMSVSSIARQISGLEDKIGARLLNRTTRHQGLTEVGKIYYEKMRLIVADIESVNEIVASYYEEVKGVLKAHIRSSAARVILPELDQFLMAHPDIILDLTLTDERADLVSGGIDVAVWLGNLEDSTFIARRLTLTRRVIVGSPAYFDIHGEPKEPGDLLHHNCIIYSQSHFSKNMWRLKRGPETVDVPVSGNLQTSTGWSLYDCVIHGLGIAVIQEWMVSRELKEGRLRRVLTDYDPNPVELDIPLFVVYPHSHGLPPKTRAFIDFLVRIFKEHDEHVLD